MASRKRARVQPARSRVSNKREGFLPNIADLIEGGGQISVGTIGPVRCAAVANDEDQCSRCCNVDPGKRYSSYSSGSMLPSILRSRANR